MKLLICFMLIFVNGSDGLSLQFEGFSDGIVASAQLQKWITGSIEDGKSKGLTDNDLCGHVRDYLNDNHGKYWHCFVGYKFLSIRRELPVGENSAIFKLDGNDWVIFKGRQVIQEEDMKRVSSERDGLKIELDKLRKEVSDTRRDLSEVNHDLERKQKEYDEYVRKMDAIKATLERILQRNSNQYI